MLFEPGSQALRFGRRGRRYGTGRNLPVSIVGESEHRLRERRLDGPGIREPLDTFQLRGSLGGRAETSLPEEHGAINVAGNLLAEVDVPGEGHLDGPFVDRQILDPGRRPAEFES